MSTVAPHRPDDTARRRRNPSGGLITLLPVALLLSCLLFAAIAYVGVGAIYEKVINDLPSPSDLDTIILGENSGVFDRTGTVKLAEFGSDRRENATFEEIPSIVIDTTTAIEDKTFWQNSGFDPLGFVAAALDTLRGSGRGGSTITQQLVRGVLLPADAFKGSVYERKIKEIIQAIRLTKEFPGRAGKEKVMTTYMNNNYYGSRAYGIRAAAEQYFGITDLSLLTLGQAALLAGIPQAPSTYDLRANAITCPAVPDACTGIADGVLVVPLDTPVAKRRVDVLNLLKATRDSGIPQETETIEDAALEAAKSETITLVEAPLLKMNAPHFVNRVRDIASEILCPPEDSFCTRLDTDGYRIVTTLDWTMQQAADKWAAAVLAADMKDPAPYLAALGVPKVDWIAKIKKTNLHNAAIATLDARTGDVLAYTGSADYYATSSSPAFQPQFDVLNAYRQPGSSIKPLVYAYALQERAITASTLFMDVPVDFGEGWTPADWDNVERGPVVTRKALQGSLNIPAVKTAIRTGADRIFRWLKDGAFTLPEDTNIHGAALAIGTMDVRYADLLSAYGGLANGGNLVARRYILEIQDRYGNSVWKAADPASTLKTMLTSDADGLITDIIAGNTDASQNPVWAQRKLIAANGKRRPATFKTGTTDNSKDLAAFGYLAPPKSSNAPLLVTGVWTGNSDATPTTASSLSAAGGVWQSYFSEISASMPIASFERPATLQAVVIDAQSGELPGDCTKFTTTEYYIPGTAPTTACSLFRSVTVDAVSGLLWGNGCSGTPIQRDVIDLGLAERDWPTWQAANLEWAERARQGVGIVGGAREGKTDYFYASYWRPYGESWGGAIAPTTYCGSGAPTPTPSISPTPTPSGSPSDVPTETPTGTPTETPTTTP
jgi:peptidoglycan glycosyltransferase